MVPGVFLERVDRSDIVGGDPAHAPQHGVRLTPLARLVVRQDANLDMIQWIKKVRRCGLHPRYVEAAVEYRHQTINEVPYKKVKKRQNFYALRKDREMTKFQYLTQ